ncbi:hypothetical protein HUU05_17365 [candidate division KSB1 bacterium]|nr:hypothetical protein [candidate division KSB1 bacterium]
MSAVSHDSTKDSQRCQHRPVINQRERRNPTSMLRLFDIYYYRLAAQNRGHYYTNFFVRTAFTEFLTEKQILATKLRKDKAICPASVTAGALAGN